MNVEEVVNFVSILVAESTERDNGLNDNQRAVLKGAWEGKTYRDIHHNYLTKCGIDHIERNIGPQLWALLTRVLGKRVSKNNLRGPIEEVMRRADPNPGTLPTPDRATILVSDRTSSEHDLTNQRIQSPGEGEMENPERHRLEGQHSPFYVDRGHDQVMCCQEIERAGALIRIKGPQKMGKTQFLNRIISYVRNLGYRHLVFDFNYSDSSTFSDVHRFSQSFCADIGRQLDLPNRLADSDYWDNYSSPISNTTIYFQKYLLAQSISPLVLALKNVDRVFDHPILSSDFCSMLRGWHDKSKSGERDSHVWQRLRLIIIHSTDIYASLDINCSPLNGVGIAIELQNFTEEQVQDLVRQYGLVWDDTEIKQLMGLVEGHPYLVNRALTCITNRNTSLNQLLQTASTDSGMYSAHLLEYLGEITRHSELATAMRRVVTAPQPVQIQSVQVFKLYSMGLVKLEGDYATPRCELYRQYFRTRLSNFEL